VLRRGQATDGGWGPHTNSPPEPFDTAVAVLALTSIDDALARPSYGGAARGTAIAHGRQFLIQRQLPDGSWPETTRPAGQESYAQRISTTAWATLALIATR
jgi:squalene cyclase